VDVQGAGNWEAIRWDGLYNNGQSPQHRIDGLLVRGCTPGDVAAVRDLGLSWRLECVGKDEDLDLNLVLGA
jgi:hypothetical protein